MVQLFGIRFELVLHNILTSRGIALFMTNIVAVVVVTDDAAAAAVGNVLFGIFLFFRFFPRLFSVY